MADKDEALRADFGRVRIWAEEVQIHAMLEMPDRSFSMLSDMVNEVASQADHGPNIPQRCVVFPIKTKLGRGLVQADDEALLDVRCSPIRCPPNWLSPTDRTPIV